MTVAVERWGTLDGRDCLSFTITNKNGLSAKVCNQGAALVEMNVPDKSGKMANVNVRHAKSDDYTMNPGSLGAICGRFANRIKGAKFTLDGKEQRLGPHEIVRVPPGVKHSWKPDPGSKLVAVQMYAPPGPEQRFKALADAERGAPDGGKRP